MFSLFPFVYFVEWFDCLLVFVFFGSLGLVLVALL